jgi:hypothetical protein
MAETELQIVKQQVSDQRQRVLKQQAVCLHLKRDGGAVLEAENALLESLRDELAQMQTALDLLLANS